MDSLTGNYAIRIQSATVIDRHLLWDYLAKIAERRGLKAPVRPNPVARLGDPMISNRLVPLGTVPKVIYGLTTVQVAL